MNSSLNHYLYIKWNLYVFFSKKTTRNFLRKISNENEYEYWDAVNNSNIKTRKHFEESIFRERNQWVLIDNLLSCERTAKEVDKLLESIIEKATIYKICRFCGIILPTMLAILIFIFLSFDISFYSQVKWSEPIN